MNSPHALPGLSTIVDRYDVLLCDVWGVIHNGRESWPAACDALVRYQAEGFGKVVLISNSPRPAADVVAQLDRLGVPRAAWSAFVTSGDATAAELARRAPGPAWPIGPERDATVYEGTGVVLSDTVEDAAFISCTGLIDDDVEGPEDYRARFEAAVERDLEMVCANPDIVVQKGSKLIYCGGALAQLYAAMGGRVTMAGKPHGPIYDRALKEAEALLGRNLDRSRVLTIGDGVVTDVLGANAQGLDCLFVASGIHGDAARGSDGRVDAEAAQGLLAAETAYARYVTLALEW